MNWKQKRHAHYEGGGAQQACHSTAYKTTTNQRQLTKHGLKEREGKEKEEGKTHKGEKSVGGQEQPLQIWSISLDNKPTPEYPCGGESCQLPKIGQSAKGNLFFITMELLCA